MNGEAIPAKVPDVTAREMDELFFVINPATSELHSMNEVGRRIWDLIDDSRSVKEVAAAIALEYEVDDATALDDVADFVSVLAERGLLTI
jgi:hypothetical protein